MPVTGTSPQGITDERQAALWVREMFGGVARRYDLLNHLLSFNIDRYWRARTVDRVRPILEAPGSRVLDLCCGTGDLTAALEAARGAPVFASDFCHPMLMAAGQKFLRRRLQSELIESDALRLPVAGSAFDLITVAFGLRNFVNYRSGLKEILRALKPGGMAAVLEFSQPRNRAFAFLYGLYSRQVLPRIGRLVSGSPDAYTYLPDSVGRFPGPEELAAVMSACGFVDVRYETLTAGVVALHTGVRPRE